MRLPIFLAVAVLAGGAAAAQSHEKPAQSLDAPAPPAEKTHAPPSKARPAPPAPLGDVRSRIATAVAAVKTPPRRARTPSAPPPVPRVTLRWPEVRVRLTWTPPEDRVQVVWPR